jgi:acetolactate synthase-1/2/3 large subunit
MMGGLFHPLQGKEPKAMASGAESIVAALQEAGVDTLFGIPSIHNIRLYEALREEPSIRHILCRQEATAGNMADGYARAGNRLGVVAASTGPGTGYMVPAMQEAWGSCSPVLLITTNIHAPRIGQGLGVLHELVDQDRVFATITKARFTVRAGDDIHEMTRQAIRTALADRPGPVYLEVPTDLLMEAAAEPGASSPQEEQVSVPDLDRALSLLRKARQPILLAGTGAVRADLTGEIRALAEALGAPVITTTNGKGILPETHPLAFGHGARGGAVREMVQAADLCLAIGTRLRESDIKQHGLALPRLVHVDWDETWIGKNYDTELALTGTLPGIVNGLLQGLEGHAPGEDRSNKVRDLRTGLEDELREIRKTRIELAYLDAIRDSLPEESILCVDNTQLGYWAEYFYPSLCAGGLMGTKGSTTIGFSFAAAIGAKVACPDEPVVALIGDGGFLYNAHELATCVRHGIAFPVIVSNDDAYGIIAFLQRNFYKNEHESRLSNPDFVALAKAYGAQAVRVDSPPRLGEALRGAMSSGEMWLIELAAEFPEPPFWLY